MSDLFGPTINTMPIDGEKGRVERGAFFTPDLLARAIARTLGELISPSTVLEPGCGGGAFLRAARAEWPSALLTGVDLLPACDGPGAIFTGDIFRHQGRYDLILGNPDYGRAEEIVRHCMLLLEPGAHLAFLLRAAFLGSTGRVALYREFPLRYLRPIAQRPSFTGGGSDPSEYALFVWQAAFKGNGEILPPLVWR